MRGCLCQVCSNRPIANQRQRAGLLVEIRTTCGYSDGDGHANRDEDRVNFFSRSSVGNALRRGLNQRGLTRLEQAGQGPKIDARAVLGRRKVRTVIKNAGNVAYQSSRYRKA